MSFFISDVPITQRSIDPPHAQIDITTLLPRDLGAAAGYEALRMFNYHRTIYRQPLMDDREREEEALAGLAIAECALTLFPGPRRSLAAVNSTISFLLYIRDHSLVSGSTSLNAFVDIPTYVGGLRSTSPQLYACAWRVWNDHVANLGPESNHSATKLWSYCQRPHDKYGRREACEVACGTAERLFRRGRRRERERERDGYDYDDNTSVLGGDYSSSDDSDSRRRRRTRRRRRSSVGLGYGAAAAGTALLQPNYGGAQYGGAQYGGAQYQPQVAGAYGLSPQMGGGLQLPGVNYQAAAAQQPYMAGYPAGQPGYTSAYGAGGLGVPQVGRPRANSFGYPPASPSYY